jgi:hypothetical protein
MSTHSTFSYGYLVNGTPGPSTLQVDLLTGGPIYTTDGTTSPALDDECGFVDRFHVETDHTRLSCSAPLSAGIKWAKSLAVASRLSPPRFSQRSSS